MLRAYINTRIFTGDLWLDGYAVVTDQGRIQQVLPQAQLPADAALTDLKGAILAPAFIDLQIYGGNGKLFPFTPDSATLKATYEYSSAGGAAFFMPTIPTHSPEVIRSSIEAVRKYWEEGGKGVLGLHLEGPFINPEKKGAHLTQYIKQPTAADIDELLALGEGIIKMMTLAPERCDPALVKRLQAAGIVVSAGHSNADYATAYQSFEDGITTTTHLFNAMSPLQSRAPGMVGAIYDHPAVHASIVADGIHVDFNAVRISKKVMGERLFLITDAVVASNEGDYIYVEEPDRYVNAQGVLAGSKLTMHKAVKNCITKVGVLPEEALRMASTYPAIVAGLSHELGKIAPGYLDTMVVLDTDWELKQLIGLY
ncbi:N-acetylglucosamine-6-phosphate deacetylase [Chitinophaga ginsengisoli]|uniref:N-acetylglucosamine 6-phosphate deacetylase n=1 Tax=Chitinophaga ginsengisoli TaxID=363837 RepID=A0A2P8GPC4_9BACT|nr:N-acetylglucosamine-6-phosphate deacetylase [Chitinophaga ginsengisoli]PSL35804.1 N-acetylglucosamine 6-phosphate deacetylase [Chitinophaga ginsengisoli]